MAPAVRTQDLFDKAGVEDDKEPVHPLERHKARAKDRSKLIRSMPKEHHRRPVTPDIEVHSITSPSPSRTPVPRQNRVDPPLTVDTTLLMNSMNNMNYMSQSATSASTQSSYPFADDASLLRYSAIPSSPMSMSLSVGVFSCEGDLPAFQDLFCTIRIGSSSSSMTEAAIAVPNEESVGVDWNQTCTCPFTSLEDKLSVSVFSSTDPACLVTGELTLGNVPFPYLGWFNLGQNVRILLRLAYDAAIRNTTTTTARRYGGMDMAALSQSMPPFSATSTSTSDFCASPLSAQVFGDLMSDPFSMAGDNFGLGLGLDTIDNQLSSTDELFPLHQEF